MMDKFTNVNPLTAMQLARRALTWRSESSRSPEERTAIDVLDAAIEQAERAEPVAWLLSLHGNGGYEDYALSFSPDNFPLAGMFKSVNCSPLYAAPIAQITEDDLLAMLPEPEHSFYIGNGTKPKSKYTTFSTKQMLAYGRAVAARCGGMK